MKRGDEEKERERRGGALFWWWRAPKAVGLLSWTFEAKSVAVILFAGFASGGLLALKTGGSSEDARAEGRPRAAASGLRAGGGAGLRTLAPPAESTRGAPGGSGAGRYSARAGGGPVSGSRATASAGGPGSGSAASAGGEGLVPSAGPGGTRREGSGGPMQGAGAEARADGERPAPEGRMLARALEAPLAGLGRNPKAMLDGTREGVASRRTPSSAMGQLLRAERASRAGGAAADAEDARGSEARAFETGGAGPVTLLTPFPSAGSPAVLDPAPGPALTPLARTPPVGREKDATPYWSLLASARTLLALADFFLIGAASASALGDKARAKKLIKGAVATAMIVVGIGLGLSDQYGQLQHGRVLMAASAAAAAAGAIALSTGRHHSLVLALGAAASGALLLIDLFLRSKV